MWSITVLYVYWNRTSQTMTIVRYYRYPGISPAACEKLLHAVKSKPDGEKVFSMKSEVCIYVQIAKNKKGYLIW